ncbi:MAG: prolipoprotein diacylglyceryl transferase [Abditibacteriaceae bacterium]
MSSFIYVDNLSPFLIHTTLFGHIIGVRWYGLAYVLGLWVAYYAYSIAAQRGYLPGMNGEAIGQMMFAIVAGVICGGRLGFVIQHPAWLISNPIFLIQVWKGGMTSFGGLIGVILALIWTSRKHHVNFWTLTDIAAFPAAFGLGIGRIANFINGELIGKPTNGNWGIIFPRIDNLPRHPSQLYESVAHFLLLGLLLWLLHRSPQLAREWPGFFAALFLVLYGALRFFTDFYRIDSTYFGDFSTGQWASLITSIIGLVLLFFIFRKQQVTNDANESTINL